MQIYLIRHGIAADRNAQTTDAERPLTEGGRKKTKRVAQRLAEMGLRFDAMLTSPLVRAQQTAVILQETGLAAGFELFTPLAPGGDIHLWVNWYQLQTYQAIALVGHQPDLGQWAEQLVWGEQYNHGDRLILKKAGIIGIKLNPNGNPLGNGELFLLTSPKWLLSP
ncbi:phosphohistidine phosphatase SixA [Spirulina sp. CCNP1310]|uniref:phosphohistidine phosphatase SixA n=1 Tax=Spirulina sp. CCNP1310 TaxID=3110249 RepID=UPI002B21353C|nr:phosphohistidine phosphatase SixA [Spirulina sp. CCNP1310]MEA5417854.1 phosphohistidine phosphatase SixA [Spirulina sp. CCNP1310]